MLSAVNDDGRLIQLAGRHTSELLQAEKDSYFCPQCQERVLIRAGAKVTPHFAHYPNSDCPSSKGGEGSYHHQGKVRLWEWLQAQGYEAELEPYIPEIQQRPDILLQMKTKRVAIEYQCARIPEIEIAKRTTEYHRVGVFPLWVLGGNRLARKWTDSIQLTSFERNFIYHFHDYRIYFYDPSTDQLLIASHLQASGRTRIFTSFHFVPLQQLSFLQLFTSDIHPLNHMPSGWKSFIKTKRLRSPGHVSVQEKRWRQYLYQAGLHPSLLPTLAYLPVTSQLQIAEAPWVWQSRYLLDTFMPASIGTLLAHRTAPRLSTLLHVSSTPSPLEEYLNLLTQLGFTEKVSPQHYRKTKALALPHTIEEALQQDEILFNSLKKG